MFIRKHLRAVSVFLLLHFLNYSFAPLAVYAFTQRSASSAPPVSAGLKDLVNLKTGDFSYSVPLLEVPGPEGGYPVTLSYNAGIRLQDESSWTGLGWNLKAGSVSRSVKGIPDDFSGQVYTNTDDYPFCNNLGNVQCLESMEKGDKLAKREIGEPLFVPFGYPHPVNQYGVLHAYLATRGTIDQKFTTFDCHALYPEDDINYNSVEMMKGGSLPTYDQYHVSAAGLTGQIEPVILENGSLFRHEGNQTPFPYCDAARDYVIKKTFTKAKQQFRFKKEFSNRFITSAAAYTQSLDTGWSLNFGSNGLGYTYDIYNSNSFNATTLRLPGGNHVDYWLNEEVNNGTAKAGGFINYPKYALDTTERRTLNCSSVNGKTYDVGKRVGGFSITATDGTTYHYALPAYTYGNVKKLSLFENSTTGARRALENDHPYAYEWLLTTITGSDFVDRNGNGYADENDTGKWINFNYGRWSPGQANAFPYNGSYVAADGTYSQSTGYQELYYLDAIYTRTHTALFKKSTRFDAKSADFSVAAPSRKSPAKLDAVMLFHNEGILSMGRTLSGNSQIDLYGSLNSIKAANAGSYTEVMTVEDFNNIASHTGLIIRSSQMTYDYSLCTFAVNSSFGKLTLKSVKNYGRNNVALTPSTDFQYELDNPKTANIFITQVPANDSIRKGTISLVSGQSFEAGDIITFTSNNTDYYLALTRATSETTYDVMFLGYYIPTAGTVATARQTKNPPYTYYKSVPAFPHCGLFMDKWGYFKSDFRIESNKGVGDHSTTQVSGRAADCWSLRKITTSLGAVIEVNYESDSHQPAQLTEGKVFNLRQKFRYTDNSTGNLIASGVTNCDYRSVARTTGSTFEFSTVENIDGQFVPGQKIDIVTLATYSDLRTALNEDYDPGWTDQGKDEFLISYVDEVNNIIRGTFVQNGTRTNPLWVNLTDDKKILYHNCSYVIQKNPGIIQGGGLRAQSISLKEGSGESYSTVFNYTNRYSGKTSGTTAYEPLLMGELGGTNCKFDVYSGVPFNPYSSYYENDLAFSSVNANYPAAYLQYLRPYMNMSIKAMASTDFTGPGVLYEYVKVSYYGNGHAYPGWEEYHFQPVTYDHVQRVKENEVNFSTNSTGRGFASVKMTIRDYTSAVGNLLSHTRYDGNDLPVSTDTYEYTSTLPASQGRLDQVFHEERKANYGPNTYSKRNVAVVTIRSVYPSVLTRVTTTDHLKGTRSWKYFNAFDFYSGDVTETVVRDSYGNHLKQKSQPAYTIYGVMGLKANNGRNMLSQTAATYTFKVDTNNYNVELGTPLAATATTWSNNTWSKRSYAGSTGLYQWQPVTSDDPSTVQDERIWRPRSGYVWKSPVLADGRFQDFTGFDFSLAAVHANWQKSSEVTQYDAFSHPVEMKDINDQYAAVKYGYNQGLSLIGSDHSSYQEIAYSGAEDLITSTLYGSTAHFGSEVGKGTGSVNSSIFHSGKSSLMVAGGSSEKGFSYAAPITAGGIDINRKYRASVWVYNNGNTTARLSYRLKNSAGQDVTTPNEGYVTVASAMSAGNWKRLTLDISLSGSYGSYILVVECTNPGTAGGTAAYFDDFRFYPASERVKGYVYDVNTGLSTHVLDEDHFYTRMVYDDAYRVTEQYKETIYGEVKTKAHEYHFGKP